MEGPISRKWKSWDLNPGRMAHILYLHLLCPTDLFMHARMNTQTCAHSHVCMHEHKPSSQPWHYPSTWTRFLSRRNAKLRKRWGITAHCPQAAPDFAPPAVPLIRRGAAWRRHPTGSERRRLGGGRSIVPAALPSRNRGPGECGAVGRSSGLRPEGCVYVA